MIQLILWLQIFSGFPVFAEEVQPNKSEEALKISLLEKFRKNCRPPKKPMTREKCRALRKQLRTQYQGNLRDIDNNPFNSEAWLQELDMKISSGGWISSGGDAVACFANSQIASTALDSEGRLKDSSRSLIQQLSVLDYYEAKRQGRMILPPGHILSGKRKLKRFMRHVNRNIVSHLSPLLRAQLVKNKREIPLADWKRVRSLPNVSDSGKIKKHLPTHCRLVQVAIRISSVNGDKPPMAFLDRGLFRKLRQLNGLEVGLVNQAMLLLHENIYLSATSLSHYNSESVRKLVRFIFSHRSQRLIHADNSHAPFATFIHLLDRLNLSEMYQLSILGPKSSERHQLDPSLSVAYLSLIERLKDFFAENHLRPRQIMRNPQLITDRFIRPNISEFSPEEALLLSILLEPQTMILKHVEAFLFERNRHHLTNVCQVLERLGGGELVEKSKQACQRYKPID